MPVAGGVGNCVHRPDVQAAPTVMRSLPSLQWVDESPIRVESNAVSGTAGVRWQDGREVGVVTGHEELDAYLSGPSQWSQFVHLEEVDSTNDEVVRRVREGASGGLIVVADHQTAGRGRAGRSWMDVPDGNLSVSVAVGHPGQPATLLPLAAGLAVVDALDRAGLRARLKWPNDIVTIRGAKLGGLLAEAHDLRPDGPVFVVIGIGLDLDWRGHDRTGEQSEWSSLAEETGRDVDRWLVLRDLLRALATWVTDVRGDPTRLLASYTARCSTLDRQVTVALPGGQTARGTAVEIDRTGGLVIETPSGRKTVMAGDVEHVR